MGDFGVNHYQEGSGGEGGPDRLQEHKVVVRKRLKDGRIDYLDLTLGVFKIGCLDF